VTKRTILPLLALLAIIAIGCSSNEDKLIDQRAEARKALDAAYAAYGGGTIANNAREQARKEQERGQKRKDGQYGVFLVGEMDRSFFEEYCLAIGSGDRPFNFSPKLEAWLKDERNVGLCRKAAKATLRAYDLERKLAEGQ
jgi:hypothetical protein